MDAQGADIAVAVANGVERLFQPIKGFAHDGQERRASLGQDQALRTALEKLFSEQIFKADHVTAKRALRHMQGLRPRSKAEVLTDRVKGSKGVKGKPSAVDHSSDLSNPLQENAPHGHSALRSSAAAVKTI